MAFNILRTPSSYTPHHSQGFIRSSLTVACVGECISYWRANLHFPCLLCLTFTNIDFWRRGLVRHMGGLSTQSMSSCPLVQIIPLQTHTENMSLFTSTQLWRPWLSTLTKGPCVVNQTHFQPCWSMLSSAWFKIKWWWMRVFDQHWKGKTNSAVGLEGIALRTYKLEHVILTISIENGHFQRAWLRGRWIIYTILSYLCYYHNINILFWNFMITLKNDLTWLTYVQMHSAHL